MMIENRRGLFAGGCLIALLAISDAAPAQEEKDGLAALTLRGFGTLGVARSTNGQAEVARDLLQPRGISDHWSGKYDSNSTTWLAIPSRRSCRRPAATTTRGILLRN